MKSFWPLLALMAFAPPLRAQDQPSQGQEEVAPPGEGGGAEAVKEEESPAEPKEEAPPADGPVAAPAEETPADGEGQTEAAPAAAGGEKDEGMIKVNVVAPQPEEADEEDVAVAKEPVKVQPTATIEKPKKGKNTAKKDANKAVKTAKATKEKVVTKKPEPPKAPVVPAIPVTPISPRNP